jgi:carboxypeptidase PM20D1
MRRSLRIGTLGLLLLGALVIAVAGLAWRAVSLPSRQVTAEPRDTGPVDADAAAHALARAIRIETVSLSREAPPAGDAFDALWLELETLFPRVHAAGGLERERVATWSRLYRWPGRDPSLAPLLLLAHTDVVPIDPGTEEAWSEPPFSGVVAGGEVGGRGAIDDKGSLVAILAAEEDLLAAGFVPQRTLLLGFGHDEEIGGDDGARAIAETLAERGVHPALVLDEGGVVSEGMIPGLDLVALVGVAEKGSVSLSLVAEAPGGHSSMPPPQSAVGIAAAAVRTLETRPPPARLGATTRATLYALAPELSWLPRLALGNADLLTWPLLRVFRTNPALDAAVRTTTAATVIHGGAKANVLPKRVTATVNFRILPGDSVDGVIEHARLAISDERVRIQIAPGTSPREPSPESPAEGPAWDLLQGAIAARFPDAVVAPYLVLGGTDARHFTPICDDVYRFLPFRMTPESRTRMHGTDERLAVEDLANAVGFYRELIRRAQGMR